MRSDPDTKIGQFARRHPEERHAAQPVLVSFSGMVPVFAQGKNASGAPILTATFVTASIGVFQVSTDCQAFETTLVAQPALVARVKRLGYKGLGAVGYCSRVASRSHPESKAARLISGKHRCT